MCVNEHNSIQHFISIHYKSFTHKYSEMLVQCISHEHHQHQQMAPAIPANIHEGSKLNCPFETMLLLQIPLIFSIDIELNQAKKRQKNIYIYWFLFQTPVSAQ